MMFHHEPFHFSYGCFTGTSIYVDCTVKENYMKYPGWYSERLCQKSNFPFFTLTGSGTRSLRSLPGIQTLFEDDTNENRDDDCKDGDHEHHEEDVILDF
jgi:hypothetical protein